MVNLLISWSLEIRKGHTEDDLWSTVMTGWNYWWMIFIFECSTSEIDQANIGVLKDSPGLSTGFLSSSASLTTSWRCWHTLGPANLDSFDTSNIFSGFKSVWTNFNRCKTIVSYGLRSTGRTHNQHSSTDSLRNPEYVVLGMARMNSVSRNQIHSSHTARKRYRGDYDDQSIRPCEYNDCRQLNHGIMYVLCIPRIMPP